MKKKTVEAELRDETKVPVVLGQITQEDREFLNLLVTPDTIIPDGSFDATKVPVSTAKGIQYQRELVRRSILSPDKLKDEKFASLILEDSFKELLSAAQELNGEKANQAVAAEKKSASPSSGGSSPVA